MIRTSGSLFGLSSALSLLLGLLSTLGGMACERCGPPFQDPGAAGAGSLHTSGEAASSGERSGGRGAGVESLPNGAGIGLESRETPQVVADPAAPFPAMAEGAMARFSPHFDPAQFPELFAAPSSDGKASDAAGERRLGDDAGFRSEIDFQPVYADDGFVYDSETAFRFVIPPGWRVVPIPLDVVRKVVPKGRYEYILRPHVHRGPVPSIRIVRLFQAKFDPSTLNPPEAAAIHILDHVFGPHERKTLLPDPLPGAKGGDGTAVRGVPSAEPTDLTSPPAPGDLGAPPRSADLPRVTLDPVRRWMRLRFTVTPDDHILRRAEVLFGEQQTVVLICAFSGPGGVDLPETPCDRLAASLQLRPGW